MDDSPPQTYRIRAAAKILGCDRQSVYREVLKGNIKVLRGFGILMIPRSEIDRVLNDIVTHRPRRKARKVIRQETEAQDGANAGGETQPWKFQ